MSNYPSKLSIVIPAYNEAVALPSTLQSLEVALQALCIPHELIVVDNGSDDTTAAIARDFGAVVVAEHRQTIGAARNRGALAADGDLLLFLDADVIVSPHALEILIQRVKKERLALGGLRALYRPRRLASWMICAYWDWRRMESGTPQGVAQFVASDIYSAVAGFRPELRMSEDIEFFLRAREEAERIGRPSRIIEDAVVWPSTRRYDQWSTARFLFFQNPLSAQFALKNRFFWSSWRTRTVR